MYRCYSTSCQLLSFVNVDCSLRIDHADISLNILQVQFMLSFSYIVPDDRII